MNRIDGLVFKQKGFVAIASILVISAVLISVSLTVTILSVGELQSAFSSSQGEDTLEFVEGCTENALLNARAISTYAGGNITRPEGTCTVSVNKVGNVWTFTVSTTDTGYVRTIRAIATWDTSGLTLTSWQEI